MGQHSVRTLLRELVDSEGISQHCGWGRGVQPSELIRVASRWFRAQWHRTGHERRSLDQALSAAEVEVASMIVAQLANRLERVAEYTGLAIVAVREQGELRGEPLPLEVLSGRCTSAVARALTRDDLVLDKAAIDTLAVQVMSTIPGDFVPLGTAEFRQQWQEFYERNWCALGVSNLTAHPPSTLRLGTDHRPALVTAHGVRETDLSGTDRSVHSRYRGYRPPGPEAAVPFRSTASRCTQPLSRRPVRDPAREEIHRVCAPYGVLEGAHRSVLRGVYFGLGGVSGGQPAEGTIGERLEGCVPLTASHETQIAVTVAQDVRRRLALRTKRNSPGSPSAELSTAGINWVDEGMDSQGLDVIIDRVSAVIMRRLWKAVHGLEQYVEETMCSCSMEKSLFVSLDKAVPSVMDQVRRGIVVIPDQPDTQAPAVSSVEDQIFQRQNATSELLARDPARARSLFFGEPGWEQAYASLTQSDWQLYLAPDEFASWSVSLIQGLTANDDGGLW